MLGLKKQRGLETAPTGNCEFINFLLTLNFECRFYPAVNCKKSSKTVANLNKRNPSAGKGFWQHFDCTVVKIFNMTPCD